MIEKVYVQEAHSRTVHLARSEGLRFTWCNRYFLQIREVAWADCEDIPDADEEDERVCATCLLYHADAEALQTSAPCTKATPS